VATRTVQGDYGVLHVDQLAGLDPAGQRPHGPHAVGDDREYAQPRRRADSTLFERHRDLRLGRSHGLRRHLDGARLFNAVVATGIGAERSGPGISTRSASASAKGWEPRSVRPWQGPRELIQLARRHRKVFGGGMRQAGIIAAGALYALENHIDRLADDHASAQILADAVRQCEGLTLQPEQIDTNMVIFRVDPALGTAAAMVEALREQGVLVLATSPVKIRAVTHLDVNEQQVRRAGEILRQVAEACRSK
jgi:threonine aldolase